ncbi:MAG: SDR family NAD(P)-dependent oxidoreductase [Actinomycetes bacterium]
MVPSSGSDPTFVGRVAIVTGAASGIGAASARHLASLGATVIATDVQADAVAEVAESCGATARTLDVSDPGAWQALVEGVVAEHGGIDFAHLNAGILTRPHPYSVLDVSLEQYRRVMGVNLDGVLLPVLLLAPVIQQRGGGAIVATASLAGLGPYYDDPFYAATKHAIVAFVRSAAHQLTDAGIRLHAICPGGVQTALITDFVQRQIDGRSATMLDPAEVAESVAAMLADPRTGTIRTIVAGQGLREVGFDTGVMPGPPAT